MEKITAFVCTIIQKKSQSLNFDSRNWSAKLSRTPNSDSVIYDVIKLSENDKFCRDVCLNILKIISSWTSVENLNPEVFMFMNDQQKVELRRIINQRIDSVNQMSGPYLIVEYRGIDSQQNPTYLRV